MILWSKSLVEGKEREVTHAPKSLQSREDPKEEIREAACASSEKRMN